MPNSSGQVIAIRLAETSRVPSVNPPRKSARKSRIGSHTFGIATHSKHRHAETGDSRRLCDELQKVVGDGKQQRIEQLLNES